MRFKSLEAFRGLAAVMIILFHSMFTSGSFFYFRLNSHLFVDFFFILSGFIISYAYMDKLSKKEVSAKDFFLKRLFRLYPMHLFMLSVWVIYIFEKHWAFEQHIGGKDPFITNNLTSFFEHIFLVQTWGTGNIMAWNVPSWSVSVELFAYLLFYFYVITLSKASTPIKALLTLTGILLLKYLLFTYLAALTDFAFLLNGISAFLMGIIVYFLYEATKHYTLHTTNSHRSPAGAIAYDRYFLRT